MKMSESHSEKYTNIKVYYWYRGYSICCQIKSGWGYVFYLSW